MNLKVEELKLVLKWFDIAEDSLEDDDLKLYDKIKDGLEEQGVDLTEAEEEEAELMFYSGSESEDEEFEDDYDYDYEEEDN